MEANQAQTLIVLGEERVARRMAEDARDSLAEQLAETTERVVGLERQVESLTNEKGILLVDISNLTKEIEELKGGGTNGGAEG